MISRSIHIPKSYIDATLTQAPRVGRQLLEPIKSLAAQRGVPMNILEDHAVINKAEIHKNKSDLWLCMEGEAVFTCGGELIDPYVQEKEGVRNENELLGESIRGGTEIILRPGDWLWIPAGEAHQHQCVDTARLVVIKIPSEKNSVQSG